ncbi:MAG: selenide, water dikinase SelD [Quadrisphaera sp.]
MSTTGTTAPSTPTTRRLTSYAHGGGCACKIPPGELEAAVAGLVGRQPGAPAVAGAELLVGLDDGDDAAVVVLPSEAAGGKAVVSTTDFFTPVVDDAYDWGRIAATNALSDVYAMGADPLVALNLLCWPRTGEAPLSVELAAEVLRGGLEAARAAGCFVAGGHSVDDPEPKYGMAVTGLADPAQLLRNDAGEAGLPLTLTKPLGLGVLNNRHKATGEVFEEAVAVMTTLNRDASRAALAAGARAATDVTGFGLLGHLYKLARASGVTAVVDAAAVPYLGGVRSSMAEGFVPGGSRRNLAWVRPHLSTGPGVEEDELLLLADAQTSGGLLVAADLTAALPGSAVVGELVPRRADGAVIVVR